MTELTRLAQSHRRRELHTYLLELQAPDPRRIWNDERENGLVSGIDQVFHFFFDDNDLDASAVGVTLFSEVEVRSIEALKRALNAVLEAVGDVDDDAYVTHPLWSQVREAAADAIIEVVPTGNGS